MGAIPLDRTLFGSSRGEVGVYPAPGLTDLGAELQSSAAAP